MYHSWLISLTTISLGLLEKNVRAVISILFQLWCQNTMRNDDFANTLFLSHLIFISQIYKQCCVKKLPFPKVADSFKVACDLKLILIHFKNITLHRQCFVFRLINQEKVHLVSNVDMSSKGIEHSLQQHGKIPKIYVIIIMIQVYNIYRIILKQLKYIQILFSWHS